MKGSITARSINISKGGKSKKVSLPSTIFHTKSSPNLLAVAVKVYGKRARKGSALAKTRSEVKGSTRKIYKQKGTGRARHGSRKAPIFVGGGKAHGPRPRTFAARLNRNQKRKAFYAALTQKYEKGDVLFVDGFSNMQPKTKLMSAALANLPIEPGDTVLFIYRKDIVKNAVLAGRNIPYIRPMEVSVLNVFAVISSDKIIFSDGTLERLSEIVGVAQKA